MNTYEIEDYSMELEHKEMSHLEAELWKQGSKLASAEQRLSDCFDDLDLNPDCKFHQSKHLHYKSECQRIRDRMELVKKLARNRSHYFYLGEDGLIEVGLGVFY